jgi:simple sugar transport system permease protein
MSLWENAVLGRQDDAQFSGRLVLLISKIKDLAADLIQRFDVRARNINVNAGTLSGGNQQKLILARELETDPKLLVAAQPTRGLDVGAIEFVWKQILEQKAQGRAVLLISAELDRAMELSYPHYIDKANQRMDILAEMQKLGGDTAIKAGVQRGDAATWPRRRSTRAARREQMAEIGLQVLAFLVALAIALGIGALIILGYHDSPIAVYSAVVKFSFGSMDGFARMLVIATPLIFSALAVCVCYKAAMFNIGVEGQYLVAMGMATIAAAHFGFLGALQFPVVLIFAMIGGMAYAAIPAVLKVKTGAHEVVTTIMLNGIAIAWSRGRSADRSSSRTRPASSTSTFRSDLFPNSAMAPNLGHLFGVGTDVPLNLLLPIAVACSVLVWFFLKRMRLGTSPEPWARRRGGPRGRISIGAVQIEVFLISGRWPGWWACSDPGLNNYLPLNYEAGLGFTGIAVAFLGQNNPFGIIAAAIMWAVLARGQDAILIETTVPVEIIIILQAS